MKVNKNLKLTLLAFTAFGLCSTYVWAAGFQLNEESASSLGMALAGSGVADDASVQFVNPAAITALGGINLTGGMNVYVVNANFMNHGSTTAAGTPLTGNASTDSSRAAPYGYATYQINDRLTAGLGVYSPYGLATNYGDKSSVRYFAQTSDLRTIEINPNIAVKLDSSLSIGIGPTIRWSRGEFSQAIDYGSLGLAGGLRAGLPVATAAALARPGANDGRFRATGTGWSAGFKAGMMWQPDTLSKIGVSYNSAQQTTIYGYSTVDVRGVTGPLATPAAASPLAPHNTGVKSTIDYPDTVTLSGSRQVTDRLKLTGDFSWTHWSHFQQLDLEFANGAPTQETVEKWGDGFRFSTGAEYRLMPALTVRGGVGYEINPIQADMYRTPRVPDGNRTWLAGGFGYEFLQGLVVNVGYAHLFVGDTGIVQRSASQGQIVGDFTGDSADIVSADLTYRF